MEEVLKGLDNKEIPNSYSFLRARRRDCSRTRDMSDALPRIMKEISIIGNRGEVINKQGFALVAHDWIKPLAKFLKGKRVIEIMAGLGTITYALQKEGIDIVATDKGDWDKYTEDLNIDPWVDVKKETAARVIEDLKADYYICAWPPYQKDSALKALLAMRKFAPESQMIYIGEGKYGCCADNEFFNELEYVNDAIFAEEVASNYHSWEGSHDHIYLIK